MFRLFIEMDGAAFDEAPASEVARILRALATQVEEEGPFYTPLFDINGNKVGEAQCGSM